MHSAAGRCQECACSLALSGKEAFSTTTTCSCKDCPPNLSCSCHVSRYCMYGDISAKTAEMMRKPDVAEYFASLLKRFSPKSMAQAMAEVTVTCRFLENFSGDQVSCADTCRCSIIVYAAMQHHHAAMPCQVSTFHIFQQQLSWQMCC